MSLSTQLLHTINRIVENLSPEECRSLSYLCGAQRTTSVKEMLQSFMVQTNKDQLFLMELMLRIRRYDLLSTVLGINKTEAEQLLKNNRVLSDYRVLMTELSEDVGTDDLELLVFLLRGTLPKERVRKVKCFLDLVMELEKLDQISSTRMDVMEKYLRAIRRVDLARRLSQYQSRAEKRSPATLKLKDERQLIETAAWQEEVYWMRSKPRGVCVIIDCVGTEGAHLEQLFSRLHFRVSHHKLLSAKKVQSCLQEISEQTKHYSMDALICCIISRSHSSQLLGTDSYRMGLDLNDVRQVFTSDSCPGLTGKPKLFFIQSYETSESVGRVGSGELETDSPVCHRCGVENVPEDADVFWSHCWTSERQLEDINHHSVYLESLQKALVDGQMRRVHLVDLHMAVNGAVYTHNHSHPESAYHLSVRHTLRKNHLYFSGVSALRIKVQVCF
ncbi:CASP8 and FADD-like apoptosis regulator [Bagarius yarrelli]|uniref:CASP8 and FADD-like apoptosis regulator n=1 Tax=Bagarius yarrelli TaxID=175774 RepID=A0A556VUX7_BAGYA|nr:CASP8 and FADD-like apoptosis regulator [Bagarius yarrelli]